ncbi:hypothetical protein ACWC5I_20320 [Kitasatospora sp. NPDC001574]
MADFSVVHSRDPGLDGRRMLTACSREHLDALVGWNEVRPFIEAELFAGKIARAMVGHPDDRISAEDLAEETGLAPVQIGLGVLWQNLGVLPWHERFGKGRGREAQ